MRFFLIRNNLFKTRFSAKKIGFPPEFFIFQKQKNKNFPAA